MRSGLDLLDTAFSEQVRSVTEETVLRLFACECASLALFHCGNKDARLYRAVDVGRRYAQGIANDVELGTAYADAQKAAQTADELAFGFQAAVEEGRASESEYSRAFGAARAAFSAIDSCRKPAIVAASDAAYEAWAALKAIVEEGNTLGNLVSPNLSDGAAIDAAIVSILRRVLEKLLHPVDSTGGQQ